MLITKTSDQTRQRGHTLSTCTVLTNSKCVYVCVCVFLKNAHNRAIRPCHTCLSRKNLNASRPSLSIPQSGGRMSKHSPIYATRIDPPKEGLTITCLFAVVCRVACAVLLVHWKGSICILIVIVIVIVIITYSRRGKKYFC